MFKWAARPWYGARHGHSDRAGVTASSPHPSKCSYMGDGSRGLLFEPSMCTEAWNGDNSGAAGTERCGGVLYFLRKAKTSDSSYAPVEEYDRTEANGVIMETLEGWWNNG